MNNAKKITQIQPVDIVSIFNDGLEQFQQFCKSQPDAVPTYLVAVQNKLNWMVGAWWCSLDEGQKTKAYENHPEFAEMYTWGTSKTYGSIFNRIPTCIRMHVIQSLGITLVQLIVDSTNDDEEKQFLINLAIDKKLSKRVMQEFIKVWKEDKVVGYQVVRELPSTGKVSKQTIEDCRFKAKALFDDELEKAKSELKPVIKKETVTQVKEDTKSKKDAEMAKRALTGVQQENQKLIEQTTKQQQQIKKIQDESQIKLDQMQAQITELQNQLATQKPDKPKIEHTSGVSQTDYDKLNSKYEKLQLEFTDLVQQKSNQASYNALDDNEIDNMSDEEFKEYIKSNQNPERSSFIQMCYANVQLTEIIETLDSVNLTGKEKLILEKLKFFQSKTLSEYSENHILP